jgi:hypothetical protein
MQIYLVSFPELAGKPYRPANTTEGEIFENFFCNRCIRNVHNCKIQLAGLFFSKNEREFPQQWTHTVAGQPTCTDFFEFHPGFETIKKIHEQPVPEQLKLF